MAHMGKKSQGKKHKFKHVEASNAQAMPASSVGAPVPSRAQAGGTVSVTQPSRDFGYVLGDMRRIMALALALVALELALWYLLSHTGLGDTVYRMIQV
jgi:hypothetical protein